MRTIESINKEASEVKLIVFKMMDDMFRVYRDDYNDVLDANYIYNSTDLEVIHGFIIGYATARQLWTEEMMAR